MLHAWQACPPALCELHLWVHFRKVDRLLCRVRNPTADKVHARHDVRLSGPVSSPALHSDLICPINYVAHPTLPVGASPGFNRHRSKPLLNHCSSIQPTSKPQRHIKASRQPPVNYSIISSFCLQSARVVSGTCSAVGPRRHLITTPKSCLLKDRGYKF